MHGRTAVELVTEFCKEPRTKKEILEMLGVPEKSRQRVWGKYISPLFTAGKFKRIKPVVPASSYVRVED